MRQASKTTRSRKKTETPQPASVPLEPTRSQARITQFMQALSRRHDLPSEADSETASRSRRGSRGVVPSARLATPRPNVNEEPAATVSAQAPPRLVEPVPMPLPKSAQPPIVAQENLAAAAATPPAPPTRPMEGPALVEMPHRSGPKLAAAIAEQWNEPLSFAPNLPEPMTAFQPRRISEEGTRPISLETPSLSRPAIPSPSWLGVAPPAPEPAPAERVPLTPFADDNDAGADLPRISGPIPMPLPVSPLAAYADSEAVREEALQPTVAHSLLRRPDAAMLMAMPYLSAAPTDEQAVPPAASSAEGVAGGKLPLAAAPGPGALARPIGQRTEDLAFDMQVNSTDAPESYSPAQPDALPVDAVKSARPDAMLAALRERKKGEALREDEEPGRAVGTSPRSGLVARQPDLSQNLARPTRSSQDGSGDDDWQAGSEERLPIVERVRTFLPREANPERAPMQLARTGMPTGGSRPQLMTLDGPLNQADVRTYGSGEMVHRQVVVQRAETGESPAGGEGGGQQGQAGGHNEEHGKQGDEGAASGDVNLLANEVYGLIKRRLAQESERMGRSR